MTDIEEEVRLLVEQVLLASEHDVSGIDVSRKGAGPVTEALYRAIEQRKAFEQKVSDEAEKQAQTVWDIHCRCGTRHPISFNTLSQFIIPKPKPDPLFDVMWDLGMADNRKGVEFMAARINDALTARGLEIREKNDDN